MGTGVLSDKRRRRPSVLICIAGFFLWCCRILERKGMMTLSEGSDNEPILLEAARYRWLRPDEICEILREHKNFQISTEHPNKPPSGSLFLFDRKVLKNFRRDGHIWRKKKDGKTMKESHETLQVRTKMAAFSLWCITEILFCFCHDLVIPNV